MKYLKAKICLILFCASLLSACNNNDDNNSTTGAFEQFSSNGGDSKEIMQPTALEQNLSSLFGSADSEPVAVNSSDSVSSIIQRLNTQ